MSSPMKVVCAVLFLAGCRQQSTSAQDSAAVAALRDTLQVAENSGNAEGMAATFAGDVIIMPPNNPDVIGRNAGKEFFQAEFQSVAMNAQYTSTEIVVSGDLAVDRGTVSFQVTPKAGGPPTAGHARYIWLLRREPNNAWKYSRITWNTDTAPVTK